MAIKLSEFCIQKSVLLFIPIVCEFAWNWSKAAAVPSLQIWDVRFHPLMSDDYRGTAPLKKKKGCTMIVGTLEEAACHQSAEPKNANANNNNN